MVTVFTNGCFDLLHPGHIYLLTEAAKLGDYLIVGLNSDSSIKQLKGADRPVWSQEKRKIELLKLDCVDAVHVFYELTPLKLIEKLRPNILVKGKGYSSCTVVGNDLVDEVIIIPRYGDYSTTKEIKRRQHMQITKSEVHDKIWGAEHWICNTDKYCGKILELKKDYQCSYHHHKIKDETFYILEGKVRMIINRDVTIMEVGDTVHIPPNTWHRFIGIEDSKILEVSTQHFDSDSHRASNGGKIN